MLGRGFTTGVRVGRNSSWVSHVRSASNVATSDVLTNLWKIDPLHGVYKRAPEDQQLPGGGDGRHSVELYHHKTEGSRWYGKRLSERKGVVLSPNEVIRNTRREYLFSKMAEVIMPDYTAKVELAEDGSGEIMLMSGDIPGFQSLNSIARTHTEEGEELQNVLWGTNEKDQTVIRRGDGQGAIVQGRILTKYVRGVLFGESDRWKPEQNENGLYGSFELSSQRENNVGIVLRSNGRTYARVVNIDYGECGEYIHIVVPEQLALGKSELQKYMPSLEYPGTPIVRRRRFREEVFGLVDANSETLVELVKSLEDDLPGRISSRLQYNSANHSEYEKILHEENTMCSRFRDRLQAFQEAHLLSEQVRKYQAIFIENNKLPDFKPDTKESVVTEVKERFAEFKQNPEAYKKKYTDPDTLPVWSVSVKERESQNRQASQRCAG